MWNTSAEYKTEIAKKVIEATWYGTITLTDSTVINFGCENIDQNRSKLTRQSVNSETLEIGNAYSQELVLGLRDTDDLKVSAHRYEFYGAVINLTFRLYGDSLANTETGTGKKYEDVPCGIFTVEKAEFTYQTATLTAYDNLYKAAKTKITTKLSDGSAYAGLSSLCTTLGVALATTQGQIEAMPNGTISWKLSSFKKETAVKDIMEAICGCIGANAVVNRSGQIEIKPYNSASVRTIGDNARYSSNYIDYLGRYTKLALENKNGEEEVYNATVSTSGGKALTMGIGKNVLLNAKSKANRQTYAIAIINSIAPILYAPLDISIPQDPSIDIGDAMTGSGTNFQSSFTFIDTKDEIPLFGQTKITSAGGNYGLANNKKATKVEKKISDLEQQTVEIGDNVAIIQTQISEISGMVNIGYILPVAVGLENIADGSSEDVLTFKFTTEEIESEEDLGEAISFHAELCFYISTTSTANSFGDGILTVTYTMDNEITASSAYSYGDGWKILTLNGFFPSLEAGEHTFVVSFSMSGGAIADQPT